MAAGTRDIKRKIKSVKNTRQITKAMELVAASKMRRAVDNALQLRTYAQHAQALMSSLSDKTDAKVHPLLAKRKVENILVIAISTDKGLCGGLNTNLFRQINEYIKQQANHDDAPKLHFVAVGKKVAEFLRRVDQKIVAAYPAMSNRASIKEISPISKMVLEDYGSAKYDKVVLLYTDFVSVIKQRPMVRRLLPLSRAALDEMVAGLDTPSHHKSSGEADAVSVEEYLFEPSPDQVLEMLLPRLTEMQIYQSVLEASASEHAARMFAMRNASEAADDMISDLTFTYNQLRQASITSELAEISAGRAAQE